MTGTFSWRRLGAGVFLAGTFAVTMPAIAGPSMSSAWLAITIDQDACMKKAQDTVRANSFNTRFESLSNTSIYGERGEYTAHVRCAADKGIVYFVVAGPTGKICSQHMNAMRDGF